MLGYFVDCLPGIDARGIGPSGELSVFIMKQVTPPGLEGDGVSSNPFRSGPFPAFVRALRPAPLSSNPFRSEPFPAEVANWAVACTKSRCEKAVVKFLMGRSVRCFLPLISKRRTYGSRIREFSSPIFSGYVFFDSEKIERAGLYESRRVANVLYPSDAADLRDDLSNVAAILVRDLGLREMRLDRPGASVEITAGALKGIRGEIVRLAGRTRLVVRVRFLGKVAELEADDALIGLQ